MPPVAGTRVIDRIVFLFHPACWAMSDAPDPGYLETYGVRRSWWYAARNRERRVVALQKEFISAMRPNELLYLHPIGDSGLMRDLERHALDTLGDRCLVERGAGSTEPAGLDGVPEPIRQAILMLIAQLYEHRGEEVADEDMAPKQPPLGARMLLAPFRVARLSTLN